jgi:recombination protein RecA
MATKSSGNKNTKQPITPKIVLATEEERKKALATAIAKIEKDYGKGTIMRLGDDISVNVEALSTGSLTLDLALGIGGVPKGRIIEIYGPEASGKTTLALHVVASAQREGGDAAYIDVEHALEPAYAKALGVDIDSLLISQPDTGEQALDIAESLVRSGAIELVVIDSVAALIPRAELDGEVGEVTVGALARLMSQAMRRLAGIISKNNCTVIFINQLRQKIGVMYGNPETTPGGLALKYYSSVRLDVRRTEILKVNGVMVGNRTKVKVVKNKVAPPFREAEFDIMYGEGISRLGEVVDVGIELDIIDKAGAWFTVCGQRVQGKDAVKKYLAENPDKCAEVEEQIKQNFHKLAGTKDITSSSASSDAKKAVDVSADDFSEDSFGDGL